MKKITLNNLNKPSTPFWKKVAVACSAASAFIAGYALIADMKGFLIAGGLLGIIGTIIPPFIDDGKNATE